MPPVLRSILAILAGFVTMAIVVMVLTLIAVSAMHLKSGHPTPGYLAVNIFYSFAAAALGGYVTARLAPSSPFKHAYILAAIMLVAGAASYMQYRGTQPFWYQVTITFLAPAAALIGARLTQR